MDNSVDNLWITIRRYVLSPSLIRVLSSKDLSTVLNKRGMRCEGLFSWLGMEMRGGILPMGRKEGPSQDDNLIKPYVKENRLQYIQLPLFSL